MGWAGVFVIGANVLIITDGGVGSGMESSLWLAVPKSFPQGIYLASSAKAVITITMPVIRKATASFLTKGIFF